MSASENVMASRPSKEQVPTKKVDPKIEGLGAKGQHYNKA